MNKNIEKNYKDTAINRQHLLSPSKSVISILLVDDEEDVPSYSRHIANEGYIVKSFANSQKALYHLVERNKTNSIPYDIVITDVRMPNINGIQLYQILRILDPLSKILFMTGLDAIAELSDLVPYISQQDILRKPFQNEHLIQKIKEKIGIPLN